jgi:hypothetical protein
LIIATIITIDDYIQIYYAYVNYRIEQAYEQGTTVEEQCENVERTLTELKVELKALEMFAPF